MRQRNLGQEKHEEVRLSREQRSLSKIITTNLPTSGFSKSEGRPQTFSD